MRNNLTAKNINKTTSGFTIVEIILVIIVIGILASISIVSYSSWSQSINVAKLKSDLNGVAAAMENSRTYGNVYPETIPTTFTASSGVTTTLNGGALNGGKGYCAEATNGTQTYNITSIYNTTPLVGPCPKLFLDAGNPGSYPGSGTTWTDLSGNGSIGTLYSTVGYNSANGGSLTFDGTANSYVDSSYTSTVTRTGNYSLSTWVYKTSTSNGTIFQNSFSTSDRNVLSILNTTATMGNYNASWIGKSGTISLNQWTNIVGTNTTGTPALYINGVSQVGTTTPTTTTFDTTKLYIGKDSDNNRYTGRIGDIRVFSKALSATEVLQNFNDQKVRYGL